MENENIIKIDEPRDVNDINLQEETNANNIEEDKVLNRDELSQAETDAKVYKEENYTTLEEAKEICTRNIEEIRRLKKSTDDNNIFEGAKKAKISKCLDKRNYLNSDLQSLKETVKDHNRTKIDEINESINDILDNNYVLTTPLSNFNGESAKEYELYIEDMRDRFDILIKNTGVVENISKVIDEDIIIGLEKLEEYTQKREKLRVELEQKKREYTEFLANKVEQLIAKHYTNNEKVVVNCFVTNIDYIEWLTKKINFETDIEELVKAIEEYDTKAQDVQDQIKKALDKEKEYESQLKDFTEVVKEEITTF